MLTPTEKADKKLKAALAFCLFLGLTLIGFVLFIHFNHYLSVDWDKPVPVDVYRTLVAAMQTLVNWIILPLGTGYLWIGYTIWNYRRKRGTLEELEKRKA